jgi:hypothetical protein
MRWTLIVCYFALCYSNDDDTDDESKFNFIDANFEWGLSIPSHVVPIATRVTDSAGQQVSVESAAVRSK